MPRVSGFDLRPRPHVRRAHGGRVSEVRGHRQGRNEKSGVTSRKRSSTGETRGRFGAPSFGHEKSVLVWELRGDSRPQTISSALRKSRATRSRRTSSSRTTGSTKPVFPLLPAGPPPSKRHTYALVISGTSVVRFPHSHPVGGAGMLRQDEGFGEEAAFRRTRIARSFPALLARGRRRVRRNVRSWRMGNTAWMFVSALAGVLFSLLLLGHLGS